MDIFNMPMHGSKAIITAEYAQYSACRIDLLDSFHLSELFGRTIQ
jgi:hypothetical protein